MAISEGHKKNLETLKRAFDNGDAGLAECIDKQTGDTVVVLCAIHHERGTRISLIPFAKMFGGNPYEEVLPPAQG